MQLGKKSKTTDMFERVRGEMGTEVDDSPLVTPAIPTAHEPAAEPRASTTMDRDAIHVTISETISAKLSREGALNSLAVTGDLTLRVSDPSLTKIKLGLRAIPTQGAQFRTHPNVNRNVFNDSKVIQMSNTARGFPVNNAVGVLRWRVTPKVDDTSACPITFTVWINNEGGKFNLTVEYELTGGDELADVSVVIPYQASEPVVSSFDASYEVSGDSVEWNIGSVSEENPSGSFEFEAESNDENDFFPMTVRFSKTSPYVDVDVSKPWFVVSDPVPLLIFSSGRGGVVAGGERGGDLLQGDQVRGGQLYDRVEVYDWRIWDDSGTEVKLKTTREPKRLFLSSWEFHGRVNPLPRLVESKLVASRFLEQIERLPWFWLCYDFTCGCFLSGASPFREPLPL